MRVNRTEQTQRAISSREERRVIGTAGIRRVQIPAWEKANSGVSPYCVPNELICGELGRYLRLPITPGAVTMELGDSPKYWYTALDFTDEDSPFQTADPQECVERLPELCAGVVLFDIYIANSDRTADNLFLNKNFDPPELRLFDHEAALLGGTSDQAEGRLTGGLRNQLGISGHCLAPLITLQELRDSRWVRRINELPDYLIEETCLEAIPYGVTDREADALIQFLKERRQNLPHLINTYKAEFGRIGRE